MDHDTVNRLIEENLQNIFGFAMSRLHDRAEAEALTSDIVYAVLRSSGQLTDDHKFYGWMWQIARICYVNRLRAAQRMPTELDEAIPDEGRSPEDRGHSTRRSGQNAAGVSAAFRQAATGNGALLHGQSLLREGRFPTQHQRGNGEISPLPREKFHPGGHEYGTNLRRKKLQSQAI